MSHERQYYLGLIRELKLHSPHIGLPMMERVSLGEEPEVVYTEFVQSCQGSIEHEAAMYD